MRLFKSLIIAFSMYSVIPMPSIEWDEDSMKYVFCCIPLVGAVCGALMYLWYRVSGVLQVNSVIYGAVSAAIPVFITGGIHLDGFCDTNDALASNQSSEKKLEIMKDSNSGAFAIIRAGIYFILYAAVFTQLGNKAAAAVSVVYVLSRAAACLMIATTKSVRKNGLVDMFKEKSQKRAVIIASVVYMAAAAAVFIWIDVIYAGVVAAVLIITYVRFRSMIQRNFGGITGDVAGYIICMWEMLLIYGVYFAERIMCIWC